MPKYDVTVTHTTVHRFQVRAQSEAEARARAVDVIKDHTLNDDVTIPEIILDTYEKILDVYDASTDPEVIRRALNVRATRGNAAGEVGRANR